VTLEALLALLGRRGMSVATAAGRVRLEGPAGALTPDVLREVAAHKPAILALLTDEACWACGSQAWWIPPHGRRVCGVCHPDPWTARRDDGGAHS